MALEYLAEYGMYKAALSLKQEIESNYSFPPLSKEREVIRELCLSGDFKAIIMNRLRVFEIINKRLLILLDYEMNETLKNFIEKAETIMESPSLLLLEREGGVLKILHDYISSFRHK